MLPVLSAFLTIFFLLPFCSCQLMTNIHATYLQSIHDLIRDFRNSRSLCNYTADAVVILQANPLLSGSFSTSLKNHSNLFLFLAIASISIKNWKWWEDKFLTKTQRMNYRLKKKIELPRLLEDKMEGYGNWKSATTQRLSQVFLSFLRGFIKIQIIDVSRPGSDTIVEYHECEKCETVGIISRLNAQTVAFMPKNVSAEFDSTKWIGTNQRYKT